MLMNFIFEGRSSLLTAPTTNFIVFLRSDVEHAFVFGHDE
jgi:hypothetical protein